MARSKYCSVEGCFNAAGGTISLYGLPLKSKDVVRHQMWVDILTKDKNKPQSFSSYSRICSVHFEESSFVFSDNLKALKPDATPTILPWGTINLDLLKLTAAQQSQQPGPTPEPPKKKFNPPSVCGNCCCSLKDEDSTTPQKCVTKYSGIKDDYGLDLYVNDAIAYIYGISWNEFCSEVQKTKESMFNVHLIEDENGRRVAFCRQCASYLYLNYTAHKNFERLSKPGSVVKQVKLFKENNSTKQSEPEESENLFDFGETPFQSNEEPVEMKWNCEFITPDENTGCETPSSNEFKVTVTPCTLTLPEKTSDVDSVHETVENFTCVHCCETFISKDGWLAHSLNHTEKIPDIANPNPTTCTTCGKVCKSYIELKYSHSHKKEKRWKCKICAKKLLSKKSLGNHLAEVHKEKIKTRKETKCEVCRVPVIAKGEKIMDAHLNAHFRSGVIYECEMCEARLRTNRELRQHRLIHRLKEPLFCKFCGRPFYFQSWLDRHEEYACGIDKKFFQCDLCPKKFHDKYRITLHKRHVHGENKRLKCNICGNILKNEYTLKTHIRMHEDADKGIEYKCDECGKILKHSISLNEHKLRVHARITRYPCKFCGQLLSGPNMLKRHENLHRTDPDFKGRPRKLKNPNKTYIFKSKSTTGPSGTVEQAMRKHYLESDSPPQSKEQSPTPESSTKQSFQRRFLYPSKRKQ